MSSLNKIQLIGQLGNAPELRHTSGGNSVCRLSVATSEKYKDKETTTWHTVNVWGKQAESCAKYLGKGKKVYVEGSLRANTFTDKQGIKRTTMEVTAETVIFLSPKQAGAESQHTSHHDDNLADLPF